MEKKYDIWVDYGYDGWDYEFGLTLVEVDKYVQKCEKADRRYFVYESAALIMENSL